MSPAGIKDVARLAGVSYKTVSRVVNGERAVSDATRRRVEDAVAALGYRPNHSARSLRRGRTQALRLIMHARVEHFCYERFEDEVVWGVVDRATRSGYSVMIDIAREAETETERARLEALRVDGTLLLDGRAASPLVPVLRQTASPTVVFVNPGIDPTFGSIDAAFADGAERMVRHLIDLGHRRIAHFTDDPALHSTRGRRAGYERALTDAGLRVDPELVVPTGFLSHHGYAAMERLLARRPDVTAVFCVNDLTALGAIDCLRERGLRVPEDLSVTGYDDIATARYATPPLSTARIPWYEMAEAATDLLIGALAGERALPEEREFPVELCIRGSTGPAPQDGAAPLPIGARAVHPA